MTSTPQPITIICDGSATVHASTELPQLCGCAKTKLSVCLISANQKGAWRTVYALASAESGCQARGDQVCVCIGVVAGLD